MRVTQFKLIYIKHMNTKTRSKVVISHSLVRSCCSSLKLNSLRISRKTTFGYGSPPSWGSRNAYRIPSLRANTTHTIAQGTEARTILNISFTSFNVCQLNTSPGAQRTWHLHVQGHQRFADTVKIDTKAHGKPFGQVSDFAETLLVVVLCKHLWEQLKNIQTRLARSVVTPSLTSYLRAFLLFKSHIPHVCNIPSVTCGFRTGSRFGPWEFYKWELSGFTVAIQHWAHGVSCKQKTIYLFPLSWKKVSHRAYVL